MSDLTSTARVVISVMSLLLSAFVLGWVVMPQYRLYITGLVLGTAASIVNARYLAIKVSQIAEFVSGQSREKRRYSLGFMTRMCIALLAVMFSIKFPQYISLVATIIGLFITQLLLIFISIIGECMKKA